MSEDTAQQSQPTVHTTEGTIGDAEVTITVKSENEDLAGLINLDLKARAEELTQIVELGRHPDAASSDIGVDWERTDPEVLE